MDPGGRELAPTKNRAQTQTQTQTHTQSPSWRAWTCAQVSCDPPAFKFTAGGGTLNTPTWSKDPFDLPPPPLNSTSMNSPAISLQSHQPKLSTLLAVRLYCAAPPRALTVSLTLIPG